MFLNTAQRTDKEELLDDFSLAGNDLRDALDKIATINRWLGGNQVTLNGIKKLTQGWPAETVLTILDIGCGNGDMCRAVADFAKRNELTVKVLGIDANTDAIHHAEACSAAYPNIDYAVMDIFTDDFAALHYDIVLCTLTLHHFIDKDILYLMNLLTTNAKLGVVINDLQRSAVAYRLFQGICFVFQLTALSREDGLTSILRGFKKQELVHFSKQLGLKNYTINWRWAFRYQWIIQNL